MPIAYARGLTATQRTARANQHLGFILAFVAGAINAGSFLAIQQYTSHMTGIVSSMADHLVIGAFDVLWSGVGALLSFLVGAACSAVMVNFARRHQLRSEYAGPLLLEAGLLIVFGALGARLAHIQGVFVPATVMLLCYIMGLQNAVITKLTKAEIRTTHVTGIVTDIGIELGKMLYWNGSGSDAPPVAANRARLGMLSTLLACFFVGGVLGAWGFSHIGYLTTVPLACVLVALTAVPVLDDLGAALARRHRR